eukprot:4192636-Amphidinium_carterae.1
MTTLSKHYAQLRKSPIALKVGRVAKVVCVCVVCVCVCVSVCACAHGFTGQRVVEVYMTRREKERRTAPYYLDVASIAAEAALAKS